MDKTIGLNWWPLNRSPSGVVPSGGMRLQVICEEEVACLVRPGWHGNGTLRCKSLATLQALYPLVSGDSYKFTLRNLALPNLWLGKSIILGVCCMKISAQHVEEISGMIYCSNMFQLFSTEAWYDIQLTLRFQRPPLVRNFFGWSLGKVWFHCSFKKASTNCGIRGLTSPYVGMLSIASAASERTEPIAARVVVGRHETLRSRKKSAVVRLEPSCSKRRGRRSCNSYFCG